MTYARKQREGGCLPSMCGVHLAINARAQFFLLQMAQIAQISHWCYFLSQIAQITQIVHPSYIDESAPPGAS